MYNYTVNFLVYTLRHCQVTTGPLRKVLNPHWSRGAISGLKKKLYRNVHICIHIVTIKTFFFVYFALCLCWAYATDVGGSLAEL